MEPIVKNTIHEILIARVPNWVPETTVHARITSATRAEITEALAELSTAGHIETEKDPSGMTYIRIRQREGLPVRRSIRVGDTDIPRLLDNTGAKYLPEHFNEAVQLLSELSSTLEQRFKRLVADEQRHYWANVVGIFSILVSVLALVITGVTRIVSDPRLTPWNAFLINLAQVVPLALVLAVFVFVLRRMLR